MFRQATASTEHQVFEREQRLAQAGANSLGELDQIYLGKREAGRPVMLVVGEDCTERMFAPALGGFDWGWPSGATRRLARALLLDVTGREPPAGVRDALATEQLAHFPWATFSLTRGELLGWIESRGYTIADWPATSSTPSTAILCVALPLTRNRASRRPLASRVARARVPSRGLPVALGASR
jgi:hypothetical protein